MLKFAGAQDLRQALVQSIGCAATADALASSFEMFLDDVEARYYLYYSAAAPVPVEAAMTMAMVVHRPAPAVAAHAKPHAG
jgi:hypothetical protein